MQYFTTLQTQFSQTSSQFLHFVNPYVPILVIALIGLALIYIIFQVIRVILFYQQTNDPKVIYELQPLKRTEQSAFTTEQLFAVLHGLAKQRNWLHRFFDIAKQYSFEIVSTKAGGITYYTRIPQDDADLVKKSLLSYLPGISVKEVPDYLSRLSKQYRRVSSYKLAKHFAYPLKHQDLLDQHDPIAYLTGSMTKLSDDDLIGFQLILSPLNKSNVSSISEISHLIHSGKDLISGIGSSASSNTISQVIRFIVSLILRVLMLPIGLLVFLFTDGKEGPFLRMSGEYKPLQTPNLYQEELLHLVKAKIDQQLFMGSIRLLVASNNYAELHKRERGFTSTLSSLTNGDYQSLIQSLKLKLTFISRIKYYLFSKRIMLPLSSNIFSATEVSDLYHFPFTTTTKTEDLLKQHSKELPAPLSLKKSLQLDIRFAENTYGGNTTTIGLTTDERRRHVYIINHHIEQIDPLVALPKLNRKITELESTKRTMLKEGRVIGSEVTDPLESAMELKDKIQRGMEKLFQISIYMTVTADSLVELDKVTKLLETVMQTRLFYIKPATFQQIEALQSILPRGENKLAQKRNLDSSSAALTFPFVSSELVQESGILYGINKSNNSLVIVDRYSLNNANSIIFAQSGSGKSFTAKVEILRHLMQGTKVIVIDPEREYKQLAKSVGGTYIKLSSTSKEKINPFDYSLNSVTGENALAEHIQDLTELISLMVGSLTSEERATVDRALLQTYKNVGLSKRKNGKKPAAIVYPLLKDFYKELKSMKHKDLCNRLERFVKGSLGGVFDSQTNIEMDNRLVVFDIKDLNESLRQIMMMVVANFVHREVKQNPQKRMLVIDEGWILLQEPESARFISGLVRRARKYYLGVTIITQQANDFLSQEYGKAIASQSSLRILMRQDTTTIKKVAEEFHLSAYEQHYLLTCERGEALIIADQNHVAVKIVASEQEHPLLTTDPREIYI